MRKLAGWSRLILATGVLILIIASIALIWTDRYLDTALNIDNEAVYGLEVVKGSTLTGVVSDLAAAGVLGYPQIFSAYVRLTGEAARIQAGEYEIAAGTTPRDLLRKLVDGKVKLYSLTIVEGWTIGELLIAVENHPAIRQTGATATHDAIVAALDLTDSHPEGWFFPETYRFPAGTTDIELLRRAHRLMQKRLEAAWNSRQPGLLLQNPYELLTLASIVERESALAKERPLIAGVFIRRLEKGMRLQTDPTVIYGLGDEFTGNLTRKHLQTDTPYNTYMRKGLPPTPIALPGADSLRAAANPAAGDAVYFVATGNGDGSHVFTATLSEHNAAVADYLARSRTRN